MSTWKLAQECFYRLDLWTPNLEATKLSYTRWTGKQPAIHPYNAIRFGNKHSWATGAHSWLTQINIQHLILAQVMISGLWDQAPHRALCWAWACLRFSLTVAPGWLSWLSVQLLVSAPGMISQSWDQPLHGARCSAQSLLEILSLPIPLLLPTLPPRTFFLSNK